jgi:hypothetical protein
MNNSIRSIPLILALGLANTAQADTNDQEIAKYAASRYMYCDAKILGALWGQSAGEAKARIGRKIGWGDTAILNGMLSDARTRAEKNPGTRCSFHEAGFSYGDAERLAKIWRTSTYEAKIAVEEKIVSGHERNVRALLGMSS